MLIINNCKNKMQIDEYASKTKPGMWPTISVSVSQTALERLEYIQESMGLKTRSACINVAINKLYDELVEQAHSRIKPN